VYGRILGQYMTMKKEIHEVISKKVEDIKQEEIPEPIFRPPKAETK
jgi:hypothetical protein